MSITSEMAVWRHNWRHLYTDVTTSLLEWSWPLIPNIFESLETLTLLLVVLNFLESYEFYILTVCSLYIVAPNFYISRIRFSLLIF